jgi:hypothetical protein
MPNLPMHIYLANQVAEQLDRGYVYDHLSCFYLGSTAPDIRAMTKWPRERTHFAPLSVEEVGTGARTMFQNHPELMESEDVSNATRSFLMGFISHLAADEVWITSMYRAHFDTTIEGSRLTSNQVEADIWDRALQLDMDRQSLPELQSMMNAEEAVSCGDEGVSVAFLEDGLLTEWKDWVSHFMGWEFSWDRLKRALNRMYRDNDGVQQSVGAFLERMPISLEEVYDKFPEAKIETYRSQAVAAAMTQIRDYF